MGITVLDNPLNIQGKITKTLPTFGTDLSGTSVGTLDVDGQMTRALGSFTTSMTGSFTSGGTGTPVYTDVTLTPPTLQSPVTITSVAQLDSYVNTSAPSGFTLTETDGVTTFSPVGLVSPQLVYGISNSPNAIQYVLTNDPSSPKDLLLDLSGDSGHRIDYSMRLDGWRNVIIRGAYFSPSIKTQKYTYPSAEFPYPKVPGGMVVRVDIQREIFFEGCHWDMFNTSIGNDEPLNGDYVVWRGARSSSSHFPFTGVTFQNCLMEGMEGRGTNYLGPTKSISSLTRIGSTAFAIVPSGHGLDSGDTAVISGASPSAYNGTYTVSVINSTNFSYTVSGSPSTPAGGTKTMRERYGDTMYHADYLQNQSKTDTLGSPKFVRFENCNLRNGQEGLTWHGWSQGVTSTRTFLLRNVDSHFTNEYANQYDANQGVHFACGPSDFNTTANMSLTNVWYSRSSFWEPCIRLGQTNPKQYLTDPVYNNGSTYIGNSNLKYYAHSGSNWGQQFVTRANLGGNYVTPH